MNLNGKQITLIISAILGALTTSTAQLTDLFGADIAKYIISMAGLCNTILSIIIATISGQGSMVKDVHDMPGVEKIVVNEKANSTLAGLAVDPAQDKIVTKPGDETAVRAAARQ